LVSEISICQLFCTVEADISLLSKSRAEGMAQVVEQLPRKCEAFRSNSSIIKRKEKENKTELNK
jgi:hypothetical protein